MVSGFERQVPCPPDPRSPRRTVRHRGGRREGRRQAAAGDVAGDGARLATSPLWIWRPSACFPDARRAAEHGSGVHGVKVGGADRARSVRPRARR